jgi:hypothetical protein
LCFALFFFQIIFDFLLIESQLSGFGELHLARYESSSATGFFLGGGGTGCGVALGWPRRAVFIFLPHPVKYATADTRILTTTVRARY